MRRQSGYASDDKRRCDSRRPACRRARRGRDRTHPVGDRDACPHDRRHRHPHGGDLERARIRPRPPDEPRAQHRRGRPECGRRGCRRRCRRRPHRCRRRAARPTDGSWSYTATRAQDATNPDLYYWTITSTGVSPDGNVTRIVSNHVARRSPTTPPRRRSTTIPRPPTNTASSSATRAPTAQRSERETTSAATSSNSVSMYVAGSLCWGGCNVNMREPAGSGQTLNLYVGKKFKVTGSNSSPVGTVLPRPPLCGTGCIAAATVVGGCVDTRGNPSRAARAATRPSGATRVGTAPGYTPPPTRRRRSTSRRPRSTPRGTRTRGPVRPPAATTTRHILLMPPTCRPIRAVTPPRRSRAPSSTTPRR